MIVHKEQAQGKWFKRSLVEQLANVGCDVERAIRWRDRGDQDMSRAAFERALELLDLTIADPKNRLRLREILRVRQALVDHFVYDDIYQTTDEFWQQYFYDFNYAAAIQRGR